MVANSATMGSEEVSAGALGGGSGGRVGKEAVDDCVLRRGSEGGSRRFGGGGCGDH